MSQVSMTTVKVPGRISGVMERVKLAAALYQVFGEGVTSSMVRCRWAHVVHENLTLPSSYRI
jgi:hypothetical protein